MGSCRLPCLLPFMSRSVTFRGLENVYLLQIETFGTWLGGMSQSVTSTG